MFVIISLSPFLNTIFRSSNSHGMCDIDNSLVLKGMKLLQNVYDFEHKALYTLKVTSET